MSLCLGSLCHYKKAGSIFVNPVHKPEARVAHVIIRIVFEMPCKGIHESAAVIAMTRVYHEAGRLVYNEQVFVFIHYIERNILGDNFEFISRAIHDDAYNIVRLHLIARLHRLPVHDHTLCIGRLLNSVARCLFHPVNKKLVDTYHLLPLVGYKTEVFIHLPAIGSDIRGLFKRFSP